MKKKAISKTAKGRLAKALVLRGSKEKTTGGLKKDDLIKNKRGKVVSKRQSALGKRRFSNIEAWVDAHMSARKALQVKGAGGGAVRFPDLICSVERASVRIPP